MAIAKLADPHRRPTTATTFNYPPWHMRIPTPALSHPLHHSKLRPPTTKPQERGPTDIAWTDEPIDAARAHRTPDWQPSRAAPLQLPLRRAAGARRTEPPPTDLLGPKHRHEPNSLTPRDGRPRLPPLQRDAKAATTTPRRRLAIPVADPIRRVKTQRAVSLNGCNSALHQAGGRLWGTRSCRQTRQGSSEALEPNTSTPARRGAGGRCSTAPGRAIEAATVPQGHSIHQ